MIKSLFLIFLVFAAVVSSQNVVPGFYSANVSSPLSNQTTNQFLIASSTGLTVVVSSSDIIYPDSVITLTWAPNNGSGIANISITSLTDPAVTYDIIAVTDNGTATLNLTAFTPAITPGIYYITVTNVLGTGDSSQFPVASLTGLDVSLNVTSAPANTNVDVNITWSPASIVGLVNISIYDYTTGATDMLATNVSDTGAYSLTIKYTQGSYLIWVNGSLGTGSALFEFTAPLTVNATPNNISATNNLGTSNTVSNITWNPLSSEANITLNITNAAGSVTTLTVPNIGYYLLNATALNLDPALYTVQAISAIGNGSAPLTVYSESGLRILEPTPFTVAYNDSTAYNVSWTPFDATTADTIISFVDLNTLTQYNFTATNNGTALLNLTSLNMPASTYNITVYSDLGDGSINNITIKYANYLTISTPNSTTIIPNNETLLLSWGPTDEAGGNAIAYLFNVYNTSIVYGPYSGPDNGTLSINLANPVKSLINEVPKVTQLAPAIVDMNGIKRKTVKS